MGKAPFPTFSGKPNPHLSLRPQTPAGLRQPHLAGKDRLAGDRAGAGHRAGLPRCPAAVETFAV